jgi:hypothetical protein
VPASEMAPNPEPSPLPTGVPGEENGDLAPGEEAEELEQEEEFSEIIRYTGAGFAGGLLLGPCWMGWVFRATR